jgi:hypothetical protein
VYFAFQFDVLKKYPQKYTPEAMDFMILLWTYLEEKGKKKNRNPLQDAGF